MADDVGSSHVRTDSGEWSDAELVRATREGSRRAYAALWKRHSVSALKYAKTLSATDADDVVSEAFLKVYAAIRAGRGPEEDFRFYIRSAVRNTYVSMVRASRTAAAGDAIEDVIGDGGAEVASIRSFDGSATARAFLSLPERWQQVLWYTEVEGLTREHTASILGLNANAVSALSFRAREALRTAWLQEHISTQTDLGRGCEAVTPMLGAYSRRGLSRRDRLRVEHHVSQCAHCTSVVDELSELLTPGRLALILLPLALAGGGAAGLASKFGGGSVVAASAVAPPAATLVAAVGGSGAATGAAALSVVGKVAACAIVATVLVPPTQMLIDRAVHHGPSNVRTIEESRLSAAEAHDALLSHPVDDSKDAVSDATSDSSDDSTGSVDDETAPGLVDGAPGTGPSASISAAAGENGAGAGSIAEEKKSAAGSNSNAGSNGNKGPDANSGSKSTVGAEPAPVKEKQNSGGAPSPNAAPNASQKQNSGGAPSPNAAPNASQKQNSGGAPSVNAAPNASQKQNSGGASSVNAAPNASQKSPESSSGASAEKSNRSANAQAAPGPAPQSAPAQAAAAPQGAPAAAAQAAPAAQAPNAPASDTRASHARASNTSAAHERASNAATPGAPVGG